MEKGEADVNEVAALLEQTKVKQHNKVSFKGRGLKLDKKEDAAEIVSAIEQCKDLQVLELVGNTVGVEAAKLIAEMLKRKPELERCLWADMFTGRLRSEIPISLCCLGDAIIEANAHLVEIDLSDNAFGPDCAKACVELLRSKSAYTIQELRFNNNGLGGGGIILAETLVECYQKSKSCGKPLALKVFVAGRNRLENPGAIALANAFKTIGTLEEIQLPQNGIQHEGIAALAEAVKHSPCLRHLNLNDNTFTEKGAIRMADGIQNVDSLEIINFGDCLVRTEGAKAIAKALAKSNSNLKQLILTFGEVELEGGLKICEALSDKEVLGTLELNGNHFGEDGVEEVKDLAKEFRCPAALGSLSDDEGNSSDSEGSDSDEEKSSDNHVDEIVHSYHNDANNINGHSMGPAVVLTAKNFFPSLNAASIVNLNGMKRERLMEEVAEYVTDAEATADACVKLAGLLSEDCLQNINTCENQSADNLQSAVFQCVDVLVADAFEKYPNTPMLVINPILVKMGLIKSEDKKHKAVDDVRGLTVVLGHISQQAYFPKFVKSLVRSVVGKENKVWEKGPGLRSNLLQLLYA